MNAVFGVILLGALFAGGAHASGTSPSPRKDASVSAAPSAIKNHKPSLTNKDQTSNKVGVIEADPKAKTQDSVTERPPESSDDSVQLKGVRG